MFAFSFDLCEKYVSLHNDQDLNGWHCLGYDRVFCLRQMRNIKPFVMVLVVLVELYSSVNAKFFRDMTVLLHLLYIVETKRMKLKDVYLGKLLDHSSGAV